MAEGDNYLTLLELSGIGVPPYSARGVTQTLEPIAAGGQQRRTINGTLVDLSDPLFYKYRSVISCTDQTAPACNGLWAGQVITVDCVAELCYFTGSSGGSPDRTAVSGSSRTEGDWTFYRPQLVMMVTGFSMSFDEYASAYAWSIECEEL